MRNTLLQRRSPLLGIYTYPTLNHQKNRYLSLGFTECNIATLLEFFHSLPEEEIHRVEHLEEFDEFEEWFIKSEHYFVSISVKGIDVDPALGKMKEIFPSENFRFTNDYDYTGVDTEEGPGGRKDWITNIEPKTKSSLHKSTITRQGHTSTLVQGVSINGSSEIVAVFGGQCHDRIDDLRLLLLGNSDITWKNPAVSGALPAKRVFHATVSYAPGKLLVIGGRTSPRKPLDDFCSLNMDSMFWEKWEIRWEGEPRSLNRWRHSATLVLGGEHHGKVLIFGGRSVGTGKNEFVDFNDVLLLDTKSRVIKQLHVTGDQPPARYSHTMTAIGDGKLALFGGLDNNRQTYNDFHIFDVDTNTWFKKNTTGDIPLPVFSHTANAITLTDGKDQEKKIDVYANEVSTHLLVIGGCSPLTRNSVHMLDLNTFRWEFQNSKFSTVVSAEDSTVSEPTLKPPTPVMFTKHTATLISRDSVCVIGGGALCFSFGNFFNGMNILKLNSGDDEKFPFLGEVTVAEKVEEISDSPAVDTRLKLTEGTKGEIKIIVSPTRADFEELIRTRQPAILRGLDFGPCKELWKDKVYLKTREVKSFSVREFKEENLDFLNKNYDFKTLPFPDLIETIFPEEAQAIDTDGKPKRYYFRTIGEDARKQPSDLRAVVPNLSKDFKVPEILKEADERQFSSILRMSSTNIRVWTHYDVMDNILCQVVGRKTVTLWHPSEVNNLYINGSTSQVLDINNPDLTKFPRFKCASRLVGTLLPGDILFIPSLWFHNTWTEDAGISVNIFFKHLSDEQYESKDLYGNKDLVIAEQAMNDVIKACERLDNLPSHYSQFYLRKLLDIVDSHLSKK